MQPCIREVVLRAVPSAAELQNIKPEDSAFFQVRAARPSSSFIFGDFRTAFNFWTGTCRSLQVQRLFTHLNHSTLEYYNPLGFCKAFKVCINGRRRKQSEIQSPLCVLINCIDHAAIHCRFYQRRLSMTLSMVVLCVLMILSVCRTMTGSRFRCTSTRTALSSSTAWWTRYRKHNTSFFFAPSDLYTENDHVTKTGSEQQTWEEKHSQKDPFSGPDG
jgi:hypothetical protein